jgi:hypothetical protein
MRRNKKLTLGVLKRVSSLQALPVHDGAAALQNPREHSAKVSTSRNLAKGMPVDP